MVGPSSRTSTPAPTRASTPCSPRSGPRRLAAGWAEVHPVARRGLIPPSAVMIYAPRDDDERAVVEALVRGSYAYARGTWDRGA